jgi:cob(I)alamin adenosyltransferase
MAASRKTDLEDRLGEWSVGELARSAGVTVRTLHHYDRIGLLVPAERSYSGHRRYRAADVRRLYQILAMRSLGFELAAILRLIDSDEPASLLDTAREQLQSVEDDLRRTSELRSRLKRIVEVGATSPEPSTDDLLQATEATAMTVRLTRIYTRKGDGGDTSLGDRTRVSKTHPIIDAGGSVDELTSHIGAALASREIDEPYAGWLRRIQNELFDVGADLTVPAVEGAATAGLRLNGDYVARLEAWCDEANGTLEPLDSFVLPGGSVGEAALQVARAVCRRAERRTLEVDGVNRDVVRYLNRLSDLLFVLARVVTTERPLWQPALTQSG